MEWEKLLINIIKIHSKKKEPKKKSTRIVKFYKMISQVVKFECPDSQKYQTMPSLKKKKFHVLFNILSLGSRVLLMRILLRHIQLGRRPCIKCYLILLVHGLCQWLPLEAAAPRKRISSLPSALEGSSTHNYTTNATLALPREADVLVRVSSL